MTTPMAVTWDYRCPFARVAHKHLVGALRGGADLDVRWVPFSLKQVHVADDEAPIWARPQDDSGLLALQVGVAVRDHHRERFLDLHEALFDARHVEGLDLRDLDVLRSVLVGVGLDADAVLGLVGEGGVLDIVRREHEAAANEHRVFGVPTFIIGDRAVFVRLMDPPVDTADAVTTIDRLVDLIAGWPALNELKATTVPR